MAHLYANENFPLKVVQQLRALGHDVLTVAEAGNAGQRIPDHEVLAYAVKSGRAILTINCCYFNRLHRETTDHRGIIVCTQDDDIEGQALRIHEALIATDQLAGQLIRIIRPLR